MQLSNIENYDNGIFESPVEQNKDLLLSKDALTFNENFTSALRILNLSGNKVIIYTFFDFYLLF